MALRERADRSGEPLRAAAALTGASDAHAALRQVAAARLALDEIERLHVVRALDEGASLAAIGRDLGLSRQAVHRRYGELAARARPQRSGLPLRPAPAPRPAVGLVLTDAARVALRHARVEAEATGEAEVGAEHVLLGLLRSGTVAALAGVPFERARARIHGASTGSGVFARDGERSGARAFLIAASREARRRGVDHITPELLLLAALADPDSAAARTLRAVGSDPVAVAARAGSR